mgnify:CR=1 FL=1
MATLTSRNSRKKSLERQGRTATFFLFPSITALALFVFWPIADSLWLSFHHWSLLDPEHAFAGLDNYSSLVKDPLFWKDVRQTAVYTVFVVPLSIALALLLALLCNEKLKGLAFFKAVYFLPVVSSFAIIAIVWSFLMDPDIGLLSYYFKQIGLSSGEWLRSTTWAMPAVILVAVWKNVGFNMVILLAGLQGIPASLYEAAKLDGAGMFGRFRSVTLPMLRHTLLFVLITSITASFQVFDQVYVMTRGGPLHSTETIVYYIYHQGFELLDMGYASSAAWILFAAVFAITIVQLKLFRYDQTD